MGQQSKPAFFKVLSHDFATHLRLPPYFIHKFGELLPEYPILRVRCGGSKGEWRVKLEEFEAEGRCFTDGWPEFARDLGLQRHDFLVFWLRSQSKFWVEVYNEDGSAKIFHHLPTQGKHSLKKEDALENDVKSSPPIVDVSRKRKKTLSFSIKMKPSNRYRVTMPANFVRETRMRGTTLVLEDPRGREWPVLMSSHGQSSTNRLDMGRGWNEFRIHNGLLNGDTCTFSYTSGGGGDEEGGGGWLLQVDVTRARSNK